MSAPFDVIVAGVGSMGSSACYHLARRGFNVLGIEQFGITHEYGSHTGQSRIIRKAYFENAAYVPLLNRAYENWKMLEEETGARLYFPTGLAYFGAPGSILITGVRQSASLYNIQVEEVSPTEVGRRFPSFKIPGDFETLFEHDAGFVIPEKTIKLSANLAIKHGATIKTGEKVISWGNEGDGIFVTTEKNSYRAQKLIITSGAWAARMIPALSGKLKITRQLIAWVNPGNRPYFAQGNFPCWMLADEEKPGCFYGFPIIDNAEFGGPDGLKLALHYPAAETDPDAVNREVDAHDKEDIQYVLAKYFHDHFEWLSHKICLYANSPDEDFIIDELPDYGKKVIVACGFSGHGFKFAPVVGEIVADLATKGATDLPVGFLTMKRFS